MVRHDHKLPVTGQPYIYGHMDTLKQVWIVTICSYFYCHFYLKTACCILFLLITFSPGLSKYRHFTWGPSFPCPVCFTSLDETAACGPLTAQGNKERYKLLLLWSLEIRPCRGKTKAVGIRLFYALVSGL